MSRRTTITCMRLVCSTSKRLTVPRRSAIRKVRSKRSPRGAAVRSSCSVSPRSLTARPRTGCGLPCSPSIAIGFGSAFPARTSSALPANAAPPNASASTAAKPASLTSGFMPPPRGGVLGGAQQHRAEHRQQHRDVLDHHQRAHVREHIRPQHADHGERRQEHRRRHLAVGPRAVAAVDHPGDHRDGHRHRHAEEHRRVRQLVPARADRVQRELGRHVEDGHADEHRDDHLEVVTDEVLHAATAS